MPRTYEDSGLLVYHSFSSEGFVSLAIEEGRVKVRISAQGVASIEIDNFDQVQMLWNHFSPCEFMTVGQNKLDRLFYFDFSSYVRSIFFTTKNTYKGL